MKLASSDTRNATAAATSSGLPIRSITRLDFSTSTISLILRPSLAACLWVPSVRIGPGLTAFTLQRRVAHNIALINANTYT